MKRLILSLLLASLAMPASAQLGGRSALPVPLVPQVLDGRIAVGTDNSTRVIWFGNFPLVSEDYVPAPSSDYANNAVWVDTYNTAGTLVSRGPRFGPFAGWSSLPQIALGPSNDTHIGWTDTGLHTLALWLMTSGGALSSSSAASIPTINSNTGRFVRGMAMDWSDNAWLDFQIGGGTNMSATDVAWAPAYPSTRTWGGVNEFAGFATSSQGSLYTAAYNLRGGLDEPASAFVETAFSSLMELDTSFYTDIGSQIFFGAWADRNEHPHFMTATPDGRFQEWWKGAPDGRDNEFIVTFNPDGSVWSTVWIDFAPGWTLVSAAACPFGGDGQLRCLCKNSSTGQWAMNTINPNAVSFTQLKTISPPSF